MTTEPLYDAVAYTTATKLRAREICKRLPEDQRAARRLRFGWRRFTIAAKLHGPDSEQFEGYMMCPDLAGSAYYEPADFEWIPVETGLAGGTLRPGVIERIEPQAAIDRQRFKGEAEIAAREQIEITGKQEAFNIWAEAARAAQRSYFLDIALMAGVRKAERLPIERLASLAITAKVRARSMESYLMRVCGSAPEQPAADPDAQIVEAPPAILEDFDARMDFMRASIPVKTVDYNVDDSKAKRPRRRK